MPLARNLVSPFALLALLVGAVPARADGPFPYRKGEHEEGRLDYINGLPVLVVEGTPEELGEQQAALTAEAAGKILGYPRKLLGLIGRERRLPEMLAMSRSLAPQIPADHLTELEAFAGAAGLDRDSLLELNTLVDAYRGGLGCSSLIVDSHRSATGGPLFGRNLDFFTRGTLQRYSIVVVCRPENKHAFVSVGFPGMLGCFSGMNDAGLALAVHEVFFSKDRAPMFNSKGVPYTFCFRRILEECSTIEEAEKLARSLPRTTLLSLALCDREGGAVLELTPRNVVVRRGQQGILACTNHFRTECLATLSFPLRYFRLMRARRLPQLRLADVARKLDQVNLGRLTMQTMIFEPIPLVLHLAIGSCPSSALPLKRLELAELFKGTD
jgi:hypothetical protein